VDRAVCRRGHPATGRLDLRQARRLDRHAVDRRRDGDGLCGGGLRDVPRLQLADTRAALRAVPGAVHRDFRGDRHR
jgi:hypothetical protein